MPKMLCNETRRRLVEGYARTHNAKQIAEAYGVTEREVYKLAAQKRDTGSVDLRTSQRGRKPKLTSEQINEIDKTIQEQPDITFREIINKLKLDISESRLGRIVREQLGYSLKKKVIHASEQERPRRTKETNRMARNEKTDFKKEVCIFGRKRSKYRSCAEIWSI